MNLELRLYPDDKDSIEASRKEVNNDARVFVVRMLQKQTVSRNPSGLDLKHANLAEDILQARFWGTLAKIDGQRYVDGGLLYRPSPDMTREAFAARAIETRKWAKDNFHDFNLNKLLNIVVNQALLIPYDKTGKSGTNQGHRVLYEDLVEKEGSMFADYVSPEFKGRLNNGRFWEMMPNVSASLNNGIGIYVVRDVLENHYDDLDLDFAVNRGIELMRNNNDGRKITTLDLERLGENGLGLYAKFLNDLDHHEEFPTEIVEELLSPYINQIFAWDGDSEDPYYNGEKDFDDIQRGRFQDKMQVPIFQKYVGKSEKIREVVAKELTSGINYSLNDFGQYSKFVDEVLKNVPNPKLIMNSMLKDLQTERGIRFFSESEGHGHNLYPLMPPR